MLIETTEGVVNTDHILSAEAVPNSPRRCILTFADGGTRTVGATLLTFERACGAIVPAPNGFTVISAIMPASDEEGVIFSEEPVIAFRINHGGEHDGPMPITVSGEPSTACGGVWTVRQPNGACFGPDHLHDSSDAFKAECERAAIARLVAA